MATASGRYTAALANQYRAALSQKTQARGGVDYSVLTGDSPVANTQEKAPEKLTGVRKILDILSQPLYSTVETAKNTAADITRGVRTDNPADIIKGIGAIAPRLIGNLGSDNDKKGWSDVLRGDVDFVNSFNKEAGLPDRITEDNGILAADKPQAGTHVNNKAGKFAVGLAADIFGDPTSYVGPGFIKGAVKIPLEVAGKTAVGAKAIEGAKATKLGQDAIKFGERLHGKQSVENGVNAGQAKAANEMADITAAKMEPLQIEAGTRIPESRQIDPYPEAPFDPAPAFGAENVGGTFQAGARADLGAEQVDGAFLGPRGSAAPVEEPAAALKQKKMLYDTQTGEVVPPSANLRKQRVGTEPLYKEGQADWAAEKPLLRPPTKEAQAKFDARRLIDEHAAAKVAPVESVAPVVEKAASPVAKTTLSMEEFLAQRGNEVVDNLPLREHARLATATDGEVRSMLQEAGIAKPTKQDIALSREESKGLIGQAFKEAQRASREDVGVARSAAVEPVSFNDYVKQVAATSTPAGQNAKKFIALATKKARGAKPLTTTEEQVLRQMSQRLSKGHAEAVHASQSLAKRAPALVTRKDPIEAQAAAGEAVAAAQSARAARARTASARRLSGAALQSWTNEAIKRGISIEHIIRLKSAKTTAEYNRAVGAMRRAKTAGEPRFVDILVNVYNAGKGIEVPPSMTEKAAEEVAQSPIAQALSEADSVEEIISRANKEPDAAALAQIGSGSNMDPALLPIVQDLLEKQGWRGPTDELPFQSNTGTRRSSKVLGEGVGKNVAYNAPMQANVFQAVMEKNAEAIAAIRAEERAKSAAKAGSQGTKWKIRSGARIYDLIIQDLKDVDDFMFANGVAGIGSTGKSGVPIYLSQMMEALNASEPGRNLLYGRILDAFGFRISRVPGAKSGSFLSAKVAGRGGTADIDSLLKLGARIARQAESADAAGIARFNSSLEGFANEFESTLRGVNVGPQGETVRGIGKLGKLEDGSYGRVPAELPEAGFVIDDAYRAFTDVDTLGVLFQHVRENSAKALIQFGQETQSVASNTIKHVLETLDNATGLVNDADRVESLLHPEQFAKTLTSSDAVAETATDAAKAKIQEVVPEIDIDNAAASEAAFRHGDEAATSSSHVNGGNKAGQKKYDNNFQASAKELDGTQVLDTELLTDLGMQTGVFKMMDMLARRFVAHYGNATVHEAMTAMGSVGGVLSRAYARDLTSADTLAKQLAAARGLEAGGHKIVAKEAWDVVRKGNLDEVGPEMAPLVGQLRQVTDYMFATPKTEGAQSVLSQWFREGFDLNAINDKLAQPRFGLPEEARLDFSKKVGNKRVPATPKDLSEQWKTWPVEDPIDFLHRMERVTSELSTETAISREFYRLATNRGLASTKVRPGFVEATRASLGEDSILRYLPKSDTGKVYIHKDLVPEIKRMDELLGRLNSNNAELRGWLKNNLDPILAMWKSGMTIWRPGHHFRNIVGDTGMAFLVSGVKNPVYYAKAVKMITAKQNALGRTLRGSYGTWDAMAAMQGLHRAAEGGAFNKELTEELLKLGGSDSPAGVIARTTIGKNSYDVDSTELFNELMNRGVLPDFRHQEDIIDVGGVSDNIVDRVASKTGWKGSAGQTAMKQAHNKLANFTEGRDDFIRLAHAMHLIENGIDGKKAWSSAEEMFDKVAARIRKTHPDGTDLTPFEKNVMRRVFPFYSWTRKAIPLVFENMLTHPGRFLVYPKAMYNFGQANGVDLESLSNPFPEDQIFPSFITDKMTGIGWESADGHYWSFDSGIPQADVLNDFIGNGSPKDISSGVLGMLNPALKVPIELASGTQIGSKVPITDSSDYVDSQIPGVNSISSIFGISPSSAVENLSQGRLGIDRTRQVERGNRGGLTENPEYLANFLFGQRLLDTTKPNYVNLGRIQQIDAMNKLKEQNASN